MSMNARHLFSNFNRNGIKFVRDNFLKSEIICNYINSDGESPFRILDIGCGNFPYLKEDAYSEGGSKLLSVFYPRPVKIYLVDPQTSEDEIPEEWKGYTTLFKSSFDQFLEKYEKDNEKKDFQFDLIILSAVTHELYLKWCQSRIVTNVEGGEDFKNLVISSCSREDFCSDLFRKLSSLLKKDGYLLLVENYCPRSVKYKAQLSAREIQSRLLKHADSPAAFFPTEEYVDIAKQLGFECVKHDSVRCVDLEWDALKKIIEANVVNIEANVVKDALESRRFECKLFQKTEDCPSSVNSVNISQLRRGFLFDMSYVVNVDKLDKVLCEWVDRENSSNPVNIKTEYDRIFWSKDGNNDNPVFEQLINKCYDVVNRVFSYEIITYPKLFSCWVSIDSLVTGGRFCAVDGKGEVKRFTPILCENPEDSVVRVYSREGDLKDWNEIAFNFFSSIQALRELLSASELDDEAKNVARSPSVYNYMRKVSGVRSLTLTYARPMSSKDSADIKLAIQEDAINASELGHWQSSKESLKKHHLIILNFEKKESDEDDTAPCLRVTEKINEYMVKSDGYYTDVKDKSYVKYLTAIYLDFLFLRRFESENRDVNNLIILFKKRWRKKIFGEFCGEDQRKVGKKLFKIICGVVKIAKKKNFNIENLPRAFITFSSPTYRDEQPFGSMMVFTDKVFSKDSLDSMVAVTERTFNIIRAVELKWCVAKRKRELLLASTKSAIGSIMSRNGSHNIGSHVLAALSHNVGTLPDDRVLYQYIQQRMDYIATVTTDFPTWTQPTMFVADMMKTFLSQRHLLDHIVESEGLRAFQFQNPNMDDDEWFDQKNCIQIHVRRVGADGEDGIDIIRYDSKDDRTKPLDLKQDIALAIPGGIVGEHAFYTILENIIRNAAKHSWVSPSLDRKKYSNLKLYIDFWTTNNDSKVNFKIFARVPLNTEESDKTQGSSDSQKIGQLVDKFESSQGLTNEDQNAFDSLPIDCRQQIMLTRRLIDSHGALRRENWGLAEMKISAGYLAGKEFDVIGGLKKSESEIIKPCVIEESKAFASEENKDAKEKYLGYTFMVEKPKEILIVVESLEGWNAEALKEYGIFVKTVAEITNDEQSRRLNYRFVVHYDARQLFDNEKKPKNGILLPFRILSGENVDEKYKTFIPQISFKDLKNAFNTNDDAIAKKNAVEKIVYGTYLEHLKQQRNKENQEKKIEKIGLLVAINENEKAGGNSLISDADILELMLEQNFAVCVDQYKAFAANEDNRKIIKCLESIRHKSSAKDKVIKFKHFSNKTIRELIAQRMCDWAEKPNDSWNSIVEHLREKYFVSDAERESETSNELRPSNNKSSDDFEANVNSLLQKHPIDDFIRYAESVFENTKKLFKQYEEQIVTLPAGYKVQSSNVGEGESLIDGIKIITSAEKKELEKEQDRHWIGYRRHAHTLPVDDSKRLYVEPLSGTQTYLSQLARVKTDLRLQMRLIENGLMRILVLDERVAKFLREHQKEVGPHYKSMNIHVIDHEWVVAGGETPPAGFYGKFTSVHKEALKSFVKPQEPNDGENNQNGNADVNSNSKLTMFDDVDILIVHQGVLDKWYPEFKNRKDMGKLLEGFKKLVKYVVVTTGRGTPVNIPKEAHLLPFAVVESTLFKKYPEKLILTDTIMNVLPVGKRNDNSGGQE